MSEDFEHGCSLFRRLQPANVATRVDNPIRSVVANFGPERVGCLDHIDIHGKSRVEPNERIS